MYKNINIPLNLVAMCYLVASYPMSPSPSDFLIASLYYVLVNVTILAKTSHVCSKIELLKYIYTQELFTHNVSSY